MSLKPPIRVVYLRYVIATLLFFCTSIVSAASTDDFVTSWTTDNPGSSGNTSISIPTFGGPYDVDWDNDGTFDEFGLSFTINHDFGVAGTYTIRISGNIQFLSFGGGGDIKKLVAIDQWGTNAWTSLADAFKLAINLEVPATDSPNLSAVTDLSGMFFFASIANPDTSNWNTSTITDMSSMFQSTTNANPDVSNWNTAMVSDMSGMFQSAGSANPDASNWNTASLTDASDMFKLASVAMPDVSGWNVSSLLNAADMFFSITLSDTLYDSILISWAAQSLQPNVVFSAGNSSYCSNFAATSRTNIILSYNWTISDAGQNCTTGDAFITTWNTFLSGTSNQTSITVPMLGGPYEVDWDNDGIFDQSGISGAVTHDYMGVGEKTIRIRGSFDTIQFSNSNDKLKILSVDQWGTHAWSNMGSAFWGAENLQVNAIDTPDLSIATSLQRMFMGATLVNPDVSNWDVSNISIFASMFRNAPAANPDVSNWVTSSLSGVFSMFRNAVSFNRDLSNWNISQLSNAGSLFDGSGLSAGNYDRLLVGWNNQAHPGSIALGALNTNYCSTAATGARNNLINNDSWTITDAGPGCASAPAQRPDLLAGSDTGVADTDNVTMDSTPGFEVECSSADDVIRLYSNQPAAQTLLHTHNCSSSLAEQFTVSNAIQDGLQSITYTRVLAGNESGESPFLSLTIDTIPPAGPGFLISPIEPTRNTQENLIGSCGSDAGEGTFLLTTDPVNGFNNAFYSFPRPLFLGGEITMTAPDWNAGIWEIYFNCTDKAGNGPVQFGPFGPVIVETGCDGADVVIRAGFTSGVYRCQGSNSITTAGPVSVAPEAVVYFQSPNTSLGNEFNVSDGAIFTTSTAAENTSPHIFGPEQLQANIGDTLVFSNTQSCDDYEDGNLPITPADSGTLLAPAGSEFFVLECTDMNGLLTQKQIEIIKN